ncbi:hypothetical protein CNMCM5623_001653 [Aspergillus felis]|uniref:Uncharacterized protein n=1 Tax=Aspergillus felis TaxID=1287682 RepID=A0A8H6UWL3_9EURO|nr:hypothetical protein CNMCM5623_001653 [Aspergillus felis]
MYFVHTALILPGQASSKRAVNRRAYAFHSQLYSLVGWDLSDPLCTAMQRSDPYQRPISGESALQETGDDFN